jgi:hypothetical protein
MRLSISRCVALETSRGWRIAKEKQSHKIDVVIALARAALGAVQQDSVAWRMEWQPASAAERQNDSYSTSNDPNGPEPNRAYADGDAFAEWEDAQSDRATMTRRRHTYRGHDLSKC